MRPLSREFSENVRVKTAAGVVGVLTVAVGCLLAWASVAFAAAPANDYFANRQLLTGSLPIEVTGSNVEATKEAGEYIPGLAPAGHSVWFEWEAASSEWVTIGACADEFPTILAVFTGTELEHLTPVASGNASEGPDCPYEQTQYTFKATSATKYVIAVDGNSFHLPEAPTPVTEGTVVLRIESTPTPPNDDFANSTVLQGSIEEEPSGGRHYFANANGYNWKATTEAGEPSHGTNSGASVWYSWTVPENGIYRFHGPCCGGGLEWGLYSGSAIGELSHVLGGTEGTAASLTAGTTYRIAIWGTPDSETGEPSMGSFSFLISGELIPRWLIEAEEHPPGMPPPPSSESSAPRDTIPPETTISKRVLKRRPPIFVFSFHSSEPESTFRYRLDRRPFAACSSSKRFGHLKPGHHVLRVVAVDAAGNEDPTPAITRFGVPKPTGREHKHRLAGPR
jgi:hypothetical protein